MLRGLILSLVMMGAATAVFAEDKVSTFKLSNGMDVVVVEDHRAPAVTQMMWYRVGSADEPRGQAGVAHFLEHLMFKATDQLASGEFSKVVAENGGEDNAFTSFDYTAYYQRVAADRLPRMMEMEADRMKNIVLSPDEIATERNVVLEERNQRVESSPEALAQEQMRAALFLNHGYGVPVIGWRHEIEQLDYEQVRSFYDLYYSPNNAILVVAGDVNPQAVFELAAQTYGPIPAAEDLKPRNRSPEPPHLAERRMSFVDERIAQPYLLRSYLAPPRESGAQEEAAALVYLAEILGGSNFTSILGKALTLESQTAINASAGYSGTALDQTSFTLSVVPAEGVSLARAEEAMDEAIAKFLAEGVDAAQLERIRSQLQASEIYAVDSVRGQANRYGSALATGLTVEDVKAWPDVLQSITAEDVLAAANSLLDKRKSVTMYVAASEEGL